MLQNTCKTQLSGKDLATNYMRVVKSNKTNFLDARTIKYDTENHFKEFVNEGNYKSLFYKSNKIQSHPPKHKLLDFGLSSLKTCSVSHFPLSQLKPVETKSFISAQALFKKRRLSPISPGSKRRLCARQSLSFTEESVSNSSVLFASFYDRQTNSLSYNVSDTSSITSGDPISDICVNQYTDLIFKLKELKDVQQISNKKNEFININLLNSASLKKKNINTSHHIFINTDLIKFSTIQNDSQNVCKKVYSKNELCYNFNINSDSSIEPILSSKLNNNFINCIDDSFTNISTENNKFFHGDFHKDNVCNHLNIVTNIEANNDKDRMSPIIPIYKSKYLRYSDSSNFEKSFKISETDFSINLKPDAA